MGERVKCVRVLVVACVALLAAACGSDGDVAATTTTVALLPPATTAPATTAVPGAPTPTAVPGAPGGVETDALVCTLVDRYIASAQSPVATTPEFGPFFLALQDSGSAGISPFIDGPMAEGAPLTIFVGSPSGESILRYDVGPDPVTGPEFVGGGPGGTNLPDVDLPGPRYTFDVRNGGYRVLAEGGGVLCSGPWSV